MLFERIQNLGGVSVFISGIKGQINDLFFCFFHIISMVGFEKFGARISYRGRALLLEAESPVIRRLSGSGNIGMGDMRGGEAKRDKIQPEYRCISKLF